MTRSNIQKYIAKAKDKNDPFRLMGFGHRVYKNFDPRATIIREMAHKVLKRLGRTDTPLFDLALELEQVALKDEYFIEKNLVPERRLLLRHHLSRTGYPNIDVYGDVCDRPYGRLGCALDRDDLGREREDLAAAAALYRHRRARLPADR